MIKKDDILEFHETIKRLEEQQDRAARFAFMALAEIKDIGSMIEVLKNEYTKLKEKGE